MIFVTVGTDKHEFTRLVKKAEELSKELDEKVIVQTGRTEYEPDCENFDFLPENKFLKYIKNADVVVTHAGVGSIVNCLKEGKPTVVVPRRSDLNEHVDDHQFDIANEMEEEGKVVSCENLDNLEEMIEEARKLKVDEFGQEEREIERIIRNKIEEWF